jgi:type VI secretion system protein ImpK
MTTAATSLALPARRAAAPTGGGVDLLSAQFRDFFAVLDRARRAVRHVAESEAAAAAQALSTQLAQLIELQTLEARRVGGASGADAEVHARFLKAALADEVLLHADWAGRAHWRHVLLEATLFRTSQAGDKVFADIDQLLSVREPSQRNLARLYLYVLALGFQGRWRGTGTTEPIADYRRELFQFIYQRHPELQGRDKGLSVGAYASTLSYLAARRLPRLSRWWMVLLLVLLGLLAASELVWLWQSWPVRRQLDGPAVVALAHEPAAKQEGLSRW